MNLDYQEQNAIRLFLQRITFEDCDPSFSCIKCGKCFASDDSLKTHTKSAHFLNLKKFTCVICYKSYESQKQLHSHQQRVHDTNKKIECSKCGKILSSRSSFLLHYRRFHPLRPSIN